MQTPNRLRVLTEALRLPPPPDPAAPTPWGFGIPVSVFAALFNALLLVTVYQLIGEIAPVLGLFAVLVVCGGMGMAAWEVRTRAVWRWVVWGTGVGLLSGLGASAMLMILGY